jgi:hypothetical protein
MRDADDDDNDCIEIEYSPLCGSVVIDGITVRVEIYRLAGSENGWSLEVEDQDGGTTIWQSTFVTDKEAYAEFYRALELEGIRAFAARATGKATTT